MWSIFVYGAQTTAPSSRVFSLLRSLGDEVSNSIRDALGRRASVRPFLRVGTIQTSLIEMIYTTGSCSIEEIKCQLEQAQLDDNFFTEAILNLRWNLCAAFRDEELYWKQKIFSCYHQTEESKKPCLEATKNKWYMGRNGR
ncbi:hypothetical protein Bca52824_077162 [Brassica carinata]|uniref:Uncharacterized protein n=1 Tax=Brassica carinata TaxID=52824 RepID=A0A8X7PWM1_BRACI|nr:hypothetical protein Bca52824_077162 [Brassica carinata]